MLLVIGLILLTISTIPVIFILFCAWYSKPSVKASPDWLTRLAKNNKDQWMKDRGIKPGSPECIALDHRDRLGERFFQSLKYQGDIK